MLPERLGAQLSRFITQKNYCIITDEGFVEWGALQWSEKNGRLQSVINDIFYSRKTHRAFVKSFGRVRYIDALRDINDGARLIKYHRQLKKLCSQFQIKKYQDLMIYMDICTEILALLEVFGIRNDADLILTLSLIKYFYSPALALSMLKIAFNQNDPNDPAAIDKCIRQLARKHNLKKCIYARD